MGQIAGGFDGVRGRELYGGKPSREMGDDAETISSREIEDFPKTTLLRLSLCDTCS
ncbi:unnamed protein product [Arabis nemorensis]|uniref:Uncharacterized protein n=1 Tax=Arabis nemorensis TaxID=586526 RepID=A0A565AQK0_9BRAS|nr:unnamed protein product [Arabis nemorensis]VVA91723.1 unnamed protein product [Arabis nemorensis]VVB09685.1 unnamed protein product [Arabis nemorensis]VVB11821.1 unnamed protein product [Arabis nemorensis]